MSARLNFNPIKYNSWKGSVFYQMSSFINKNTNKTDLTVKLIMKPLPLNIFRRTTDITPPSKLCNSRNSLKIDDLNRPGSTFVIENTNNTNKVGLVNYITNDITECTSTNIESCIHMPDMDARRRVRSAGMIRRKYNPARNNDTYCTSSNQYLVSRNRTFSQNQYNFIRQGNSSVKPGSALSKTNVYSPNGISHCVQPYISVDLSNNQFQYKWVNGQTYTVVLPTDTYDVYKLNNYFENAMTNNSHYFINKSNSSLKYLLNIAYDDLNKQVVLVTKPRSTYPFSDYDLPGNSLNWNSNMNGNVEFIIPNTPFQNIIGFTAGTYSQPSQNSNIKPNITSNYVTITYKPNNPQFSQQGGVSSSTLISRKRFDVITGVGAKMKAPYGSATANALAYGVSDHQYTIKDKIGFPLKKTPVISKYTGEVKCVDSSLKQRCN